MFHLQHHALLNSNPINDILSLHSTNQTRPFKSHWLNSAHLETLLPGSTWEKIYDIIIPELCLKINSEFSDETKKQAFFELLGKNFTSKQFPHESINVAITKPPYLSTEDSIKLYAECEKWLTETTENIIKQKSIYDEEKNIVSEDMMNYMTQANEIFTDHFYKELAKREADYLKSISTSQRNFRSSDSVLHHKPETAVSSVYDKDLPDLISVIYPYAPEMMIAAPPHCNSFQSEFIGSSLSNLCQNNQKETLKIIQTMSGRRLPISLRKLIWKNVLLESDLPVYDTNINYEELMKEKFSRTVTRGIGDLKISQELTTPITELLEHTIVEQYERCLPLAKFCNDFKSEAIKILNLLYAYERSYDRHLIFLLFPLHYGLKEETDDIPVNKVPFAYEVAMYLSLFKNVYPSWTEIFDMAENVILKLANWNSEFVNHLLDIAQKNVLSQTKEFLAQIINLEKQKTKATKPLKNASTNNPELYLKINNLSGFDLIKSPIIFVRKWIGEGFVSILKSEAVLYIFDQLFIEKFTSSVFQDACLAVILLLKDKFLQAHDHQSMKDVFLQYPFDLFTLDIIRAWYWIHKGGSLDAVPDMNRRQRYAPLPSLIPETLRPPGTHPILLPDVAFNDLRLKLVFTQPLTSIAQNIKEQSLILTLSLCYSDKILLQLRTQTTPKLKSIVENDKETVIVHYIFDPLDIIKFQNVDVSHLTSEFKSEDSFEVLVMVHQVETIDNVINLGWCTVQCYVEDRSELEFPKLTASQLMNPENSRDKRLEEYVSRLRIQNMREEIALNFKDFSKDITNFEIGSNTFMPNILAEGSLLGIYLYDPKRGPPTPPPKTPVSDVIEPGVENLSEPDEKVATDPEIEPTEHFHKKPVADPRLNDDSYVPYNPESYEKIKPPLSSKTEAFCVYIDQIRFLPDNATIIKVTGRFVLSGSDEKISDLLLFPDVESDTRSPTFRGSSRVIVNEDRQMLLRNSMLLVLRVYTVLKTNLEVVVIGNCILPVFSHEGVLLAGCFQKRLHNYLPEFGLLNNNSLTATSLDQAPYVDCVSITLRLWPFTKNPVAAPDYRTGCYQSAECQPSDFEWDVFDLYKRDTMLSKDLRDVVRDIKLRDAKPEYKDIAVTHAFMQQFSKYRLDIEIHLPPNQAPRHIKTELMFHYRIEKGIHFKVDQIYGLNNDLLAFATAKVLRGFKTANVEARESKKYGSDKFVIFSDLDPNRSVKAPKWKNSFEILHPYFDEQALLIIQVWGIKASLVDGELCFRNTREKILKLTNDNIIGWTAIELFKNGFVNSGKHQMPLYQNRIHLALLKRFQTQSITGVLQKEEEFKDLDSDSIIVYLLDGHKKLEEYPSDLPVYTEIIDSLPEKKQSYMQAMNSANQGKTVKEEIFQSMEDADISETGEGSKITVFQTAFTDLAEKLSVSIPPKQPYMPIII